ncbi:14131_t:CDS:1 [Cetraspora pellucida]|uniref:14131_t:CDS:1 n=1 Tax=Cetraspora pellucida TaxID=1433469 RepID=A0A9N8ZIY4_9GLOM|nr:14131_t:CDS:1 [Cetraspora pellucida]
MSFRMPFAQPIITLIYNPSCSKSNLALSILQEALTKQPDVFKLDILDYQKQPPTKDQLKNIVQYLGVEHDLNKLLRDNTSISTNGEDTQETVKTALSVSELSEVIKQQPSRLQRPILVDWNKGKAIIARPPEKVEEFLKELGYLKEE